MALPDSSGSRPAATTSPAQAQHPRTVDLQPGQGRSVKGDRRLREVDPLPRHVRVVRLHNELPAGRTGCRCEGTRPSRSASPGRRPDPSVLSFRTTSSSDPVTGRSMCRLLVPTDSVPRTRPEIVNDPSGSTRSSRSGPGPASGSWCPEESSRRPSGVADSRRSG